MPRVRTSRRVPPLKDSDIDHEIYLEDHSPADDAQPNSRPSSPETDVGSNEQEGDDATSCPTGGGRQPFVSSESESETPLREGAAPVSTDGNRQPSADTGRKNWPNRRDQQQKQRGTSQPENGEAGPSSGTPVCRIGSTSTNGKPLKPTPTMSSSRRSKRRRASKREPESEIDILYENERGGLFCGIPLFSSAALGNLDPPAWTNGMHKPSPTGTKTAQVPDPSWEWAWPEWHINRDPCIETDEQGWEYSFMFSKKFSWHKPKWWNSFVRRRAWIRPRVKRGFGYEANDPHLIATEYFSVEPPTHFHRKSPSATGSGGTTKSSTTAAVSPPRRSIECQLHQEDHVEEKSDIETIDVLMALLRRSRIDREKLEAVQNYLEHASDHLLFLQEHMHDIMSLFVFQASRKLLLTRLTDIYDDNGKEIDQDSVLGSRVRNLAAAIKHADEEVRKLEYWSDVRYVAESGQSHGAVDGQKGWQDGCWEGLDISGPIGANKEKLPSSRPPPK